jgi:hypothetical protein
MPYNTHGFQIVIEVSEAELNERIAQQFACTTVEEQENGNILFPLFSRTGDSILLFDTPWIDLRGPEQNTIALHMPFHDSYVERGTFVRTNVDGQILINEKMTVQVDDDNKARVMLHFDDQTDINVQIHGDDEAWTDLLRNRIIQETRNRLMNIGAANLLGDVAFQQADTFDLGSPTRPLEIDAQIIYGDSTDKDAIAILQRTIPKDVTHWEYRPKDFSQSAVGFETRMAILINSDFILRYMIGSHLYNITCPDNCDQEFEQLFDFPATLKNPRSVSINNRDVTYTQLSATIPDSNIEVSGTVEGDATSKGVSFSYQASFNIIVTMQSNQGQLLLDTQIKNIDVTVDGLPIWVYVLNPDAGEDARSQITEVLRNSLKKKTSGIEAPDIGGIEQIALTGAALGPDVLLLQGDSASGEMNDSCGLVEVSECRVRLDETDTGIDLDRSTDPSHNPKHGPGAQSIDVDLLFDWPNGISTQNHAALRTMGTMSETKYARLNPQDIENLNYDYPDAPLSLDDIPALSRNRYGLLQGKPLVVGIRTNRGRYTKAKLWKSLYGTYYLCYTTYNRQIEGASLDVESYSEVQGSLIGQGTDSVPHVECDPGRGPRLRGSNNVPYKIHEYRYTATISAKTPLLSPPLSYEWTIENRLIQGQGSLSIDKAEIEYQLDGAELQIRTQFGESSSFDVFLRVEDNRGFIFEASKGLTFQGTKKTGGVSESVEARRTAEKIEECMERARAHQRSELFEAMKASQFMDTIKTELPFDGPLENDAPREPEMPDDRLMPSADGRKSVLERSREQAVEDGMNVDLKAITRRMHDLGLS